MTTQPLLADLPYTKTTLANGLDVIVRRQPHLPIVAVNLWYHVGSKDEERSRRGFAHLFEHLMFEGSEHYPGDFFQHLKRVGANVNGSTSTDRTNYFEDLPAAHLELALAMESDRMGHLLPALDDHKLRVQKDVVKNEYRQNYANRPYGQVWRLMAEAMYPPEHPYSWLTIGVMEDVEAASRDDVEDFFRRYYVPANASLCIVGDVDESAAASLAERYFGPLPGGNRAATPWSAPAPRRPNAEIRLDDRVELDRLYLAWHTVPQFHADDAPLALLADVMGRGRSSRLYKRMVMDEEVAQDVSTYHAGRELAGSFGVIVTLRPGKSWERARAIVEEELDSVATRGIAIQELERAKNGRLAGFIYALDNVGGFGGVADRLNAYNVYLGDPGRITSDLIRFRAPNAARVASMASNYLTGGSGRVSLAVVGRKAKEIAAIDRATAPVPRAAVAYRAPAPEVRPLACGAPLWVIPRRDLPIVAATAVVRAGAGAHGPDRGGLASLTASMMDEGTASRSAREIAEAAEGIGTSLSTSCGWDGSYVGLQCLTPHWPASAELAADVLLRPSFPESEWSRVAAQSLAALRAERDSADARAHRVLLGTLYGPGHPYRIPVDGDLDTVAAVDRGALVDFHRAQYAPDRAAWVVAGDVDPDEVAGLLDGLLAGWSASAAVPPAIGPPARGDRPRILLLDKPGAPQAVLRAGHVGLERSHADHDALQLFNHILGGQFTSRLNSKLREEKGFTYGVRSGFDFRRGAGPFVVSASLQADRLGEAIDDLRAEMAALLGDRPPTAAEVDDARRSLIEGQARLFETPSALVSRFAGLFVHDLPPDHHVHLADRLDAVGADAILGAAGRHVRPDSLVLVVVADADQVEPDLRRLGWASVERLDDQ